MGAILENVFSETEVREIGIRIQEAETAEINECVGSWEEELETRTVSKKCRGIITKSRTKGTGRGTIKASLHMGYDLFATLYGMKQKGLKDGVIAYGTGSLHPVFCVTAKVLDEDDNVKYKAYPNCTITSAISRKVENGGEEIAEIEVEIAVSPDENGNGLYEATEAELQDATAKKDWMAKFKYDLVKAPSI